MAVGTLEFWKPKVWWHAADLILLKILMICNVSCVCAVLIIKLYLHQAT